MMGSENNQGFEEAHLYASREEMENLVLEEALNNGTSSKAYSNHWSERSALAETHHPLSTPNVTAPADSDPLLWSPPYRDLQNPNVPENSSYIEPPAYADVIFSSFDEKSASEINGVDSPSQSSDSALSFSRSPSSCSDYIKITVSNPQKEQETTNSLVPGGNTYVTYLITTRTNIPEFGGSEFSVRRRFRDVVTLSDRLAEAYRGFFIPPRPDKNVVESQVMQKQEFVEQRRVALEKYLRRLAAHPVIRKSDELKVFLQVQGKLPLPTTTDVASRMLDGAVKLPKQLFGESSAVVATHEVVQPAIGGRDLLRLFKELKQSVSNDWGGSKPSVVEEDKEFMEKKEKMQALEQQLSNASQQAELLVKAQQDLGETMGELGLAFIKLTKFENEEAVFNSQRVRAADMKNIATAAVKASRFYRELNAQTVKHLDTLHEYLGLMLSVHSAFSERSNALLTVQTLISELSSLRSRAEKLEAASSKIFGGDKSRIRKMDELKETLRVTEDAKIVAIREYERIKENNRSELERLDSERREDFSNMLRGFVLNQTVADGIKGSERSVTCYIFVTNPIIICLFSRALMVIWLQLQLLLSSSGWDMRRKLQMCGQKLQRRLVGTQKRAFDCIAVNSNNLSRIFSRLIALGNFITLIANKKKRQHVAVLMFHLEGVFYLLEFDVVN
ncbi:sorting nexin 2B-like isoform X2 [Tripterygium wilfordii]|uniref:sorting nexin 2B-like isoform X2 n=1 Tax=Tripterygium wilfordii TaxID=458696 RepID=UPI0018F84A61|nr:sorting nexin 2B-like isoform X2 [Tripterygium wilfordii]